MEMTALIRQLKLTACFGRPLAVTHPYRSVVGDMSLIVLWPTGAVLLNGVSTATIEGATDQTRI
jgi:hypothetical protein